LQRELNYQERINMSIQTNFGLPSFATDNPAGWGYVGESWWTVINPNLVSADSATQATFQNYSFSFPSDLGLRIKLTGSGFAFSNGAATGGTLNQLELVDANGTLLSRITLTSGVPLASYLGSNNSSQQALLMFGGNDVFNGQDGADYLTGYSGSDTLIGGDGDDVLSPGNSINNSAGGVEPQADSVDGGAGTDIVFLDYRNRMTSLNLTFSSQQTANGQTLSDGTILRNIENVHIAGGTVDDTITGGGGDDLIMGGAGQDSLNGGGGNDTLAGFSDGRYGFNGFLDADTLDGGAGVDTAYLGAQSVPVSMFVDFTLASTASGTFINAQTLVRNVENINFTGGNASDSITGGTGADTLAGGAGVDTIRGGAGDDVLIAPNFNNFGTVGTAVLDGGSGTDKVQLQLNPGTYQFGSIGNATGQTFSLVNGLQALVQNTEAVAISNFGSTSGFYNLVLTAYDDEVFLFGSYSGNVDAGAGDDDILILGSSASIVLGGAGNDTVETGIGNDSLNGGTGADILDGSSGNDTILGGDGDDILFGGAGADSLDGGAGFDTANYSSASATVQVVMYNTAYNTGDAAGDTLLSIEMLQGSSNIDILVGGFLGDSIVGGASGDWIDGTYGGDTLYGEEGNDSLVSRQQADVLNGGADFDYARYDYADAGLNVFLHDSSQNSGWALGDTLISIEGIAGSYFGDNLQGDAAGNVIFGLGGADYIVGFGGADLLIGGSDADIFHYTGLADGGDVIQDFGYGADRISVNGANFGLGTPGPAGAMIDSWRFVAGTAATVASSQFIYNAPTGQFWYDQDGTGAGAQVLLATLQAGAVVTAGDILVL
jgi:Ca2+-binding RTX toxin-like protein